VGTVPTLSNVFTVMLMAPSNTIAPPIMSSAPKTALPRQQQDLLQLEHLQLELPAQPVLYQELPAFLFDLRLAPTEEPPATLLEELLSLDEQLAVAEEDQDQAQEGQPVEVEPVQLEPVW
jgi:hypothetical protein